VTLLLRVGGRPVWTVADAATTKGSSVSDIEVTIATDDRSPLAGTLTLPAGAGPHPAVLLLHGSGRLDRDGNTRRTPLNLGGPLAAVLAARGIATLRYDRRGVGASPGDWHTVGFTDNRRDALSALRMLAEHPAIGDVAVVGHSEGAVHAMAVAPHAKAVVLLAGYARLGEDALRWLGGSMAKSLPLPKSLLRRLGTSALRRIKEGRTDAMRIAGLRVNARWVRELLVHDTRVDLAAITVPTLAITGDNDLQVDPDDLEVIRRLVTGPTEILRVPGLTHILRVDHGPPSLRTYPRLFREPVAPRLLDLVADWLTQQLHPAGPEASPRASLTLQRGRGDESR
jgi:pimeloyl-ACP methyl ester carboxylesterase